MKDNNLKKKLFIAGANLLILLALLIYVSYSAYRIHVAAEVEMLQAAHMQAGFEMSYDLNKGADSDPNNNPDQTGWISDNENLLVLDRLLPGERASVYAASPSSAREKGREVTFKVFSTATLSQVSPGEASPSEVPMGIKIVVEETGPLPLEIILKDDKNSGFEAHGYTGTEYGFDAPKTVRFYKTEGSDAGQEYIFRLDTVKDEAEGRGRASRTFKLYFGWNNNMYQSYDDDMKNEVATINVRAELVQLPPIVIEETVPENPATASELKVYHRKESSQ